MCLPFHISASFWAFLWPGLRNKYSYMCLATWSGATFILLSLWQGQLVQFHLGRELSHLLKSVSSWEIEFSLLRYWRCKFLHPKLPLWKLQWKGRASDKWCYPLWCAHRPGAHLTSLNREGSWVLFLPQTTTRRGFLICCWQCSGLSSIIQNQRVFGRHLWRAPSPTPPC